MTQSPKEKADELMSTLCGNNCTETNINRMQRCAVIMVIEIVAELQTLAKPEYTMFVTGGNGRDGYERIDFWQQVKAELEKK